MVLHVTHVVQAQLEDAEFSMRQNETLPRRFIRQTCDMGSAFFAGELEVRDQLGFAVNPLGQDFIGTGFVHREWRVRRERLWGFGQVKIQPEQRVVGDVPILEEVDLIAPNFFWAFLNGVLEHLNRCTELLPEDFPESLVHDSVYAAMARSRVGVGASRVRFAAFFNFNWIFGLLVKSIARVVVLVITAFASAPASSSALTIFTCPCSLA
jgi:hypothetical protein